MQRFQRMRSRVFGLAGAAGLLVAAPVVAQPGSSKAAPAPGVARAARSTAPPAAPAPAPAATGASSVVPGPRTATGARVALAERYAEEAYQAYASKDYAGAVALYHKALEAAPSADIVYNLARVYDLGLRDRPLAIHFYTRFLGEPGAAAGRLATARSRLGELSAEEQATRPEPPPVAAPIATPTAPVEVDEVDEVDERDGSVLPALAIGSGALGLIGVGVGVGFGFTAKSRLDVSRRYCEDNACTTQRGVEATRSAARAADVATVGFVAGGGLLALGTLLWLVADDEPESRPAARDLKWTPGVAPGEVSLAVSGSFTGP